MAQNRRRPPYGARPTPRMHRPRWSTVGGPCVRVRQSGPQGRLPRGPRDGSLHASTESPEPKIVFLLAGLSILTLALIIVAPGLRPGLPRPANPSNAKVPRSDVPVRPSPKTMVTGLPSSRGRTEMPQGSRRACPAGASVQTDSDGIELSYDYTNGGVSSIEIQGDAPAGQQRRRPWRASPGSGAFPGCAARRYQLPDPLIGYPARLRRGIRRAAGQCEWKHGHRPGGRGGRRARDDGFVIIVEVEGSLLPTVNANSPYFDGHSSPPGTNMAYFAGDFIVNRNRFP